MNSNIIIDGLFTQCQNNEQGGYLIKKYLTVPASLHECQINVIVIAYHLADTFI